MSDLIYKGYPTDDEYQKNVGTWIDVDFPIIVRTTGPNIPTLTTFNGNLIMPEWGVNNFSMCESQELIHSWKEGSTCFWHLHLTTNGTNVDDRYVRFELEYAYSVGGQLAPWTFPAVFTTDDILIAANTPTKTQRIFGVTSFTPTGAKIGDHVLARLRRVAAAGTAPTGDPWIPMLQLHILTNSSGSREMISK